VERLELDLGGLVVVTEAGTNHFALTPILAAHAGAARVYAVSRDSRWGEAAATHEAVERLRRTLGAPDRIESVETLGQEILGSADLVTNLGWVRPLDEQKVEQMRPGAVISAMCEAWEIRAEDIDLVACARRGVRVAGVNEDHPRVDVFEHNGLLAVKMLQRLQIEVHGTRITIVGNGKFAERIATTLEKLGADVRRTPGFSHERAPGALEAADAIVIADYAKTDLLLGEGGEMSVEELLKLSPYAAIVQFAGWIRADELRDAGIALFPGREIGPRRMGCTMAFLGPAPLIDLHGAGLKVGAMLLGKPGPDGLVQPITSVRERFALEVP
jgi:hypothetical protein